jgi:hypothetical protein
MYEMPLEAWDGTIGGYRNPCAPDGDSAEDRAGRVAGGYDDENRCLWHDAAHSIFSSATADYRDTDIRQFATLLKGTRGRTSAYEGIRDEQRRLDKAVDLVS